MVKEKKYAWFFNRTMYILLFGVVLFLLTFCTMFDETGNKWEEYRDERFGYKIMIPEEWKVDSAPETGQAATMSIMNYDPSQVIQTEITDEEWPEDILKVDIVVVENIPEGMAFSDAMNEHFMDDPYYLASVSENNETGTPEAFTVIFENQEDPEDRIKSIGAWLRENKIIAVFVYPERAWENNGVKDMLKTIILSEETKMVEPSSPAPHAVNPGTLNKVIKDRISESRTSRAPGDEVGPSPISPLYMPFSPGTQWTVGGVGYFYGEGTHSDANNDYYATDWNKGRPGAYQYDAGEPIYPVADGIVVSTRYNAADIYGGYGNYVKIQHAEAVVTIYAHMSSVDVVQDQEVNINTKIGTLGTTGNSTGPHLHMSFRVNGVSQYAAPQAKRPSPMWTTAGYWELTDGGYATVSKTAGPSTTTSILPTTTTSNYSTTTSIYTTTTSGYTTTTSIYTTTTSNYTTTTSSGGPVLAALQIPNPGSGIYAGLKITHCIEGGLQRVWIVNSSRTQADFTGYETQNGWCGPSAALRFHGAGPAAGTWITWCSGYAQGEEYVWQTDGSEYAPFLYPQYNGSCPQYQ